MKPMKPKPMNPTRKDSPVYRFPVRPSFNKSMEVCSKCEYYQRDGYLGRWNWESGMIHHEKRGQHMACFKCQKILEHMVMTGLPGL